MNVIFMRKKSLALTLMLAFSCLLGGDLMGQTTITIGTGTSTTVNSPINTRTAYSLSETIYLQSEINQPSKPITSIAYYYNRATAIDYSVDIYMQNTEKTSFSASNDYVTVSAETDLVYRGTVSFPNTAGWVTITLDSPFEYNSNYNLLVIVDNNQGTGDGSWSNYPFRYTSTSANTCWYANGTNNYDPTSSQNGSLPGSMRPNIQITFDDGDSCMTPTDLSAVATSSTTANISWTAGSTETAWQLYYSNVGYATPYNASEGDFITINTTPSYTLTGLIPNTEHFVYVRAKCGEDDFSDWTDVVSFTTFNPQSLPVINDFEDGEDDLEDWTMRDANANTGVFDSETYSSSSYCFRFYSPYSGSTQYLITPELNGTTNGVYVQFYRKQPYAGAYIQVGYSTETISTEDFTWSEATPNAAATKYVSYELYCPAGTKFVAIKYTATTNTLVYIDNISITVPPTANTNGNWNNAATWATGAVPSSSANVVILSDVTIPNGYTATANNITIAGGSLTIADGGQLICNNAVEATVHKTIAAWNTGLTGGWYFIASPINVNNLAPTNVTNMISDANAANGDRTYDLYSLDNITWHNYRANPFNLANGQGYLYASKDGADLQFSGAIKAYDANYTISVFQGWNLIGNPYTFEAYPNQAYYTINDANSGITAQTSTSSAVVAPCTGIIVKAAEDGTVKFLKDAPETSANNGNLQMVLAHKVATRDGASVNKNIDNAIVSFNEGSQLEKFYFGNPSASIFIPQNGEDYAIAFSDRQGDVPLYFKANETGTYTISFAGDEMSLNGIYLIDILAEEEIDLSVNPSYTFIGSPADRMARFKIVFRNTGGDGTSDIFAYQSGNDIIVSGEGELQIFDVMGRMVSRQRVNGVETVNVKSQGVYIFRLNDKTQKIVVR